jgi:hypothetical protein
MQHKEIRHESTFYISFLPHRFSVLYTERLRHRTHLRLHRLPSNTTRFYFDNATDKSFSRGKSQLLVTRENDVPSQKRVIT